MGDGRSIFNARILIGVVIAAVSVLSYCSSSSFNAVTGKKQYVVMTPEQEVAVGVQSAPTMAAQFGGLAADPKAQALADQVGAKLVRALPAEAPGYPFEFHVLADTRTVNAFALPGGQVFITMALLSRLETEGQLAGVLGHEIGHVLGRHSAERMAQQNLTQGLVGAATVAGSGGQDGGRTAQMAASVVGSMINLKYGRDDELEADRLGLLFMERAGYDPRSLIKVMKILEEASGGRSGPEFASSHPNPGNRAERIAREIEEKFGGALRPDLIP